jgi:pseudaminic acid biosynthesis-associated methylase
MTEQLDAWKGDFGKEYTERNMVDWRRRVPAFRQMVGGRSPRQVLEVGCNRGHNLVALSEVMGTGVEFVGVEPNEHARQLGVDLGIQVVPGDIFALPFPGGRFELVFTAGVLIHLSALDVPRALAELYRCSRRYLLAVEYYAAEETIISYRGSDKLLWKRDFLKCYQELFPGLKLLDSGVLDEPGVWDNCTWWLLEKSEEAP